MIKIKKSQAHLEMILSFIIFAGFLIVLISLLNPFKVIEKKEIFLDDLERGIKAETSSNIQLISIYLNESPQKCFYFDYNPEKVIVFDKNLKKIPAYSLDNKVYINDNNNFYYIYSYLGFEEKVFSENCKKINVNFGLLRILNITEKDKWRILEEDYQKNYESLKINLGIPSSKEFSFFVINSTSNLLYSGNKNLPAGIRITSREIPIQIIDNKGEIDSCVLNMKIW